MGGGGGVRGWEVGGVGNCRSREGQAAPEEDSPGFGGSIPPPTPEKEMKVNEVHRQDSLFLGTTLGS